MQTISPELKAHLGQETTTLATCWKVVRKDGKVFGFTDHDKDIVFESQLYSATGAYTPSAIEQSADLSVDNLEVQVLLSSTGITEADILAGEWDYAEVWIFLVNYEDLTMGSMALQRGNFGEVQINGEEFVIELRSLSQRLQQVVGRSYLAACDAEVGDARCGVDMVQNATEEWQALTAVAVDDYVLSTTITNTQYKCTYAGTTGATEPTWDTTVGNTTREVVDSDWAPSTTYSVGDYVAATTYDNRRYRCTTAGTSGTTEPSWDTTIGNTTADSTVVWTCEDGGVTWLTESINPNYHIGTVTSTVGNGEFVDSTITEASAWFAGGLLTWLSGNNAGRQIEVRSQTTTSVQLFEAMPENIQVGDKYMMHSGCSKDFSVCKSKYNNGDNFRGFPHIPGRDEAIKFGG